MNLCGCSRAPEPLLEESKKILLSDPVETRSEDHVVAALVVGQDLLRAQIEALQVQLAELLSLLDAPLEPAEMIQRIRRLRGRIYA